MIFNWKANSAKVLREGRYSRGDKWEAKKEYSQQLFLCAYLSSLGWPRERVFEKWSSIPTRESEDGGVEPEDMERRFSLIFKRATEKRYSDAFTLDYGKEHEIYAEEVEAVNALDAPISFKRYLLCMAAVAKFYLDAEGRFELTKDIRGWCCWHATGGTSYSKMQKRLMEHNIKAGRPLRTVCVRGRVYAELAFLRKSGEAVIKYRDPSEAVDVAAGMARETVKICPVCGEPFEVHSHTQRDVCESCQKKRRLEHRGKQKRKERKTVPPSPHFVSMKKSEKSTKEESNG